jgi:hypothetical protein
MKKHSFFIMLFLLCNHAIAQKFNISYGPYFGANTSFMNSKSSIDYNYVEFSELPYRNLTIKRSGKMDLGYSFGLFIKMQPLKSHLNIETGFVIIHYLNTYTVDVSWERPYNYDINSGRWLKGHEKEKMDNEFKIISIPVIVGYDIIKSEKYGLALTLGLSPSKKMKDDKIIFPMGRGEVHLYKDYFIFYQAGIRANFNKITCSLKYDRSLNVQQAKSRDFFGWSMKIEKLYINALSLSIGLKI